ncbi:TPA: NADH dehydrogenase, partial [Candidatus Bathyarchaeota archaeon]|nr:NADH dehydrogenase [Candidatus Bathyarchaeota archaeon]
MMNADPLILVAIPFIGGAAVLAVDRLLKRARDAVSLLVMAGLLAVNSRECYRTFFGHSALGALTAASGMVLDPPGLMVSELVLIVALLSMVFSIKYMRRELGGGGGSFYALFLAFVGTLMGLAFSTNILLMLFFLEASSVISAVLILYGGRGRRAVRATAIYLGLSVIESILVVLGVFTLASAIAIPPLDMTSVDISTLYGRSPLGHGVTVAALLLLLGFGTKAGLAPLGMIWLPPAYSEAPAPVSAMLSGVMSKAGFLAMFRCAHALATHSPYYVMAFLVLCSLLSIVLGIVGALIDSDVKRVLAYSSIAQMGYIAFGAGLGLVLLSAQTAGTVGLALKALKGGFYHLMNHSIFKLLLFLASGIFWYHLREREFKKMRGVGLKMPVTTALWLLGSW